MTSRVGCVAARCSARHATPRETIAAAVHSVASAASDGRRLALQGPLPLP